MKAPFWEGKECLRTGVKNLQFGKQGTTLREKEMMATTAFM